MQCWAARATSAAAHAGLRNRGHRQDQPGGHFVDAACRRGERCLYFSLRGIRHQLIRNMRSIGHDLARMDKGRPASVPCRPSHRSMGLEMHLATMHKLVTMSSSRSWWSWIRSPRFAHRRSPPSQGDADAADGFPQDPGRITGLFTSLTSGRPRPGTDRGGHLLADGHLAAGARSGDQRRAQPRAYILKSRGMAHSNQMREFISPTTASNC